MKKTYLKPVVAVTNVQCTQMIAESLHLNSGSGTVTSGQILSHEREDYNEDDNNGWSDGLW